MYQIPFGALSGKQVGVFSDALVALYKTPDALDAFLRSIDAGSIYDVTLNSGLPNAAFMFAEQADAWNNLEPIWREMLAKAPNAEVVRKLPARVQALSPSWAAAPGNSAHTLDDRPAATADDALQRMVREGAFGDPLIFADAIIRTVGSMCHIQSRNADDEPISGTGFLVGADRVLTAGHVLANASNDPRIASEVSFTFGFADGPKGLANADRCELAETWKLAFQPHSTADVVASTAPDPAAGELDFALVRIDRHFGKQRGVVNIDKAAPTGRGRPKPGAQVMVFQHPEGGLLRHGIGWVLDDAPPHRLRYDARTDQGSSGGLVVDEAFRPLALHHAGDPDLNRRAEFNQGVPLNEISAALRRATPGGVK